MYLSHCYLVIFLFIAVTAVNTSSSECSISAKLLEECTKLKPSSTASSKESHPWQVAIYKQYSHTNVPVHKCTGTLISALVLVTGAHCLAEDSNGAVHNANEYFVAAGNQYREFDDKRDETTRQVRNVKNISVPPVYRGHGSAFTGDLAVVVVDKPFELSSVIWPACINWDTQQQQLFESGNTGVTNGWGLTIASRHPDTKETQLKVPLVDNNLCQRNVAEEFHKFLENDKFCGEFSNGNSICLSDNGGGLLIQDSLGVSYLQGVGSVGLIHDGTCETKQYGAFTSVIPYRTHICKILQQNQ